MITLSVSTNQRVDFVDITSRVREAVASGGGQNGSHIKTSLVGSSEQVFIEHGKLVLGRWQGIFLCDFDGPRTRKVYLKILSD